MYRIVLAEDATRAFEQADAPFQKRLDRCFEILAIDPRRHNNIKRLRGKFSHLLRFRIGDWRVVYRIDNAAKQVDVLDIAHRREVYE